MSYHHNWSTLFDGHTCRLCRKTIQNGSGKAGHAAEHLRANDIWRGGNGSKESPFCYNQNAGTTPKPPAQATPKTCAEIKKEWRDALDLANEKYNADIKLAREREFPIGSQVRFQHGVKWFEATVTKHGEWDFNVDAVTVRNNKTGTEWEKKAWELRRLPDTSHPTPRT